MGNIFKISKRGIIAILTLCILFGIAGICLNVTAMAAENTATVEETAVAIEEIATVVIEESTISTEESTVATEDTTVVVEENTQELVPRMATRCCDPLTSYFARESVISFFFVIATHLPEACADVSGGRGSARCGTCRTRRPRIP